MSYLLGFMMGAASVQPGALRDVSLWQLLNAFPGALNAPVTMDGELCERFTVFTPDGELTPEEQRAVLLSALGAHGYSVVPKDGGYRIRNTMILCFSDLPVRPACRPLYRSVVTQLVRPADASQTQRLRANLSRNGELVEVPSTGALVVTDDYRP